MTRFIVALAAGSLAVTGAFAQATHDKSHNPVMKDSDAKTVAAPAEGANSFTEDQARGRLAKAGYSSVSELKKDDNGVWRGSATKAGKKVQVGLDYKGNVTTN